MPVNNISDQLTRDEGVVEYAYQDSLGYWTIAVGRLIDKRKGGKLRPDEIQYLLKNDIDDRKAALGSLLPWFKALSDARQGVLLNMAFQLGTDGLMAFKNTLALVQSGDYKGAAAGMRNSTWYKQTTNRAERLAKQMETDTWI